MSTPIQPAPAADGTPTPPPPAPAPRCGVERFALWGKIALVTGGCHGIGEAISTGLARAGADVVVSGRDAEALTGFAAVLAEHTGVRTWTVPIDLADADAPAALSERAHELTGRIDILVNNAGISIPAPAAEVDIADWDRVMAVNLRAPALLAAAVGARMARSGGGRIVNVASVAGLRALREHYSYCASKAALVMAGKVLALELGDRGVRVNTVCPTVVLTEMGQRVWGPPEKSGPMLARIPNGHFAQPHDVADAVVYLASEAAEMLNGTELVIDGGFSAN